MAKDKQIKITLIKSPIGYKEKAKKTVEALGLRKINQSVIHNNNNSVLGMINLIYYLVKVEEI